MIVRLAGVVARHQTPYDINHDPVASPGPPSA
jgi:hypothetical protein